ncbi:hypothetical protein [Dickeya chrysanthemi]|uniref:hypothetical protein n=1 Tax=Dickeya chrysanthemi TaxID=556 RepID=UPI0034A5A4EA|nr:hypothetical protein [Dickeya chrysanthemi]
MESASDVLVFCLGELFCYRANLFFDLRANKKQSKAIHTKPCGGIFGGIYQNKTEIKSLKSNKYKFSFTPVGAIDPSHTFSARLKIL